MDLSLQGGGSGSVAVSDDVFGRDFNEPLVHQVVTAFMAGARAGTKAQKTRADVRGGGAKPWRQKGTGRARSGTSSSPIWRGGGRAFAARPRDYSQKVNRKMYRGAIRSILSELVRQGRFIAVEDFTVDAPKTKDLVSKLKDLGATDALIVTENPGEALILSSRNVYGVDVRDVTEIDPASLIAYNHLIITVGAIKRLEEVYG